MLLSEIGDKEIIDISKGSMHGRLWDAEMLFDETTGVIHSYNRTPGKLQIFFVATFTTLKIRHGKRVDNTGGLIKKHFGIPKPAVHAAL